MNLRLATTEIVPSFPRYFKIAGHWVSAYKIFLCIGIYTGTLVSAAVAHQRGEKTKAMNLLSRAAEAFDLADMDLYEAVARRRSGELSGGERGLRDIHEADAWMRKRQIKNPDAMTRLLAPGFD